MKGIMSKNKEEQARMEGMVQALRIAKEKDFQNRKYWIIFARNVSWQTCLRR